MSLIRLKCKVRLYTEDQIETIIELGDQDLPNLKPTWLIRDSIYRSEDIAKIVKHSKSKTMVYLYDGEEVLVHEPFIAVYNKWEEAEKKAYASDSQEVEKEEIEDEEEEDTED